LVLSGGNSGGVVSEAEFMAGYAVRCGYRGELVVESESRSTWENIRNVVSLVEDVDRIKIVSHSLHAEKGRAYLARCRPDLAARLVPAADYRFGEWILVKPWVAVLGWGNLRRIARAGVSRD
jgi:hypothetical protein